MFDKLKTFLVPPESLQKLGGCGSVEVQTSMLMYDKDAVTFKTV